MKLKGGWAGLGQFQYRETEDSELLRTGAPTAKLQRHEAPLSPSSQVTHLHLRFMTSLPPEEVLLGLKVSLSLSPPLPVIFTPFLCFIFKLLYQQFSEGFLKETLVSSCSDKYTLLSPLARMRTSGAGNGQWFIQCEQSRRRCELLSGRALQPRTGPVLLPHLQQQPCF